ncbi:HET-domain-containing protein [Xylariaceae sp. AK1471]|nr:HET-domain-containing protein [Xylariaceae sp. AK1471]
MEWHDTSCPRLDLISRGGFQSCLRCGSFTELTPPVLHPSIKKQSDIRLLRLFPGYLDEDIKCEIFVQDLLSRPEYEAISYTWADETGNTDPRETIFVSGQSHKVTRNCENALKRIRSPYNPRTIWIDAVCINQNDPDERGHQVRLMPQIYSRAQRVLVYVGEEADESCLCMDVLAQGSVSSQRTNDFTIAANHLLDRAYFSRAWVLQEIALARKAILICGDRQIPWTQLSRSNVMPSIVKLASTPVIRFEDAKMYTTPERLLDLLDLSRNCDAKDPRDKVYAILGLVIDKTHHGLEADYNLSIEELYTKVALRLASRHGWAKVLQRAGSPRRHIKSVPSWVPDWSCRVLGDQVMDYGFVWDVPYEAARYDPRDRSLSLTVGCVGNLDVKEVHLFDTPLLARHTAGNTEIPSYLCFELPYMNKWFPSFPVISYKSCALKIDRFQHLDTHTARGNFVTLSWRSQIRPQALLHCAQDISAWLNLIDALQILSFLNSVYSIVHKRIGEPWLELIQHIQGNYDLINNDITANVLRFEPPAATEVERLWRDNFMISQHRHAILRGPGRDYTLLVELNDAIWRMMVRLFLWREVEIKIT